MTQPSSSASPFLLLPCEIRLQIYTYLLTPPLKIHPLQRRTTRSSSSSQIKIPTLNLTPQILTLSHQIHLEALPLLYTHNTFCAHPTLLTSLPYLLHPHRPITSPDLITYIKKWYLNIRLDTDPRFTPQQVSDAFTGSEELEIEVWQAEYGTSDLVTLKMFEGVRGIKRAKVTGSVGGRYCRWLEGCMRLGVGEVAEPFLGEEGEKGYDLWTSGNR